MLTYLIIILFLVSLLVVPFIALAEMIDVSSQVPIRCGPQCVIETKGFTDHNEAIRFAMNKLNINKWEANKKLYCLPNNDLWFVDYQVTEEDSSLVK